MRVLIIALICAFVIGSEFSDDNKKNQDNQLLDLVFIKENDKKICTGIMLRDLTILASTACVFKSETSIKRLSIGFPNITKSYRVIISDTDGDIVALMLDENENPPKCKFRVQLEKTDIFEGAGEMQILVTDKTKDTIMKLPVEVSKTEECSQLFKIDLKHKICLYAPEVNKNDMAKWVRGSPWIVDGLLAGMYDSDLGLDKSIVFIKFLKHLPFLQKYSNNSLEHEESTKKDSTKISQLVQ